MWGFIGSDTIASGNVIHIGSLFSDECVFLKEELILRYLKITTTPISFGDVETKYLPTMAAETAGCLWAHSLFDITVSESDYYNYLGPVQLLGTS